MFRFFGRLHTRLLLHKQDQLVELEQRLDALDNEQSKTNPYPLVTTRHRDGNAEREVILEDVEKKLKEYSPCPTFP